MRLRIFGAEKGGKVFGGRPLLYVFLFSFGGENGSDRGWEGDGFVLLQVEMRLISVLGYLGTFFKYLELAL